MYNKNVIIIACNGTSATTTRSSRRKCKWILEEVVDIRQKILLFDPNRRVCTCVCVSLCTSALNWSVCVCACVWPYSQIRTHRIDTVDVSLSVTHRLQLNNPNFKETWSRQWIHQGNNSIKLRQILTNCNIGQVPHVPWCLFVYYYFATSTRYLYHSVSCVSLVGVRHV